ncbi:MAG: flagellar hook-associated protein FlgK, partial [Chloroflexi bacterium]|nr:flagellar hook-associated protein FlgK [Chloroflexota bacterium]
MSILLGLNTAIRALLTQQVAIATVSHNVANANTPGFTRQDVVMETTDPFTVPTQNRAALAGQIGTGVTVRDIRRIRDLFLDTQFRLQSSGFGYWDA